MATGDSNDIVLRVKKLIPTRWFAWVAPYRDAILGALADRSAWCYGLIAYARQQTRLATVNGVWLDIYVYDFLQSFLPRNSLNDDVYRATAKATILQERVTRLGMNNAVLAITGTAPFIFEPWNTFDTGAYSGAIKYGSMGYGVGRGGYGSMSLPSQTFMKVQRGTPSGVPLAGGYNTNEGGYGAGGIEYIGTESNLFGVTNAIIENIINKTKPTGSTVWMQFGTITQAQPRRPLIFKLKADTQNIAVI